MRDFYEHLQNPKQNNTVEACPVNDQDDALAFDEFEGIIEAITQIEQEMKLESLFGKLHDADQAAE